MFDPLLVQTLGPTPYPKLGSLIIAFVPRPAYGRPIHVVFVDSWGFQ